ncbi:family 43 glycosylhydrolase [Sphingobacterium griseoflavum]|uniref:F5/8 type C domain-containing protein n=1 Tax=Sphingobacterium griseoflavum TaxID=1474952 RepID=A0ABQ3I1W0_9SPHI|nr:family 43 glycosylhydrolase [Sphingobacterium griseoflavum]GHE45779.1 hypothetical protein GCM10017764_31300 [Sphingobacterium griseoflavum]
MILRYILSTIYTCCASIAVFAQTSASHLSANAGNPILPGYFADPTIKKIGDTYYMYATTDGNGGGFGPSQVWASKDFVHWAIQPMNWPNTHWYWAPDMTRGYDGRYYLYYSQPVELFGAVSDTPVGPWTSLVEGDKAFVPNYMIPGAITLDGQTFTDDDGKIYMFWGTWGIYPDHGCAVGLMNADMKSFERIELIPNTIAKDYFEAPIMFKRCGIYYLLYSSGHCEDDSYRVQYVKSKAGPFGPYEYPAGNPILVTNGDGTIHGPGHNGILEENGKYYIVYHRHNNPHSGGGFHRQVAADELFFDDNGDIKSVVPTHQGIGLLATDTRPVQDIAFGKSVTASSSYSDDFQAAYAVDNNNGTLWRAKNNSGSAWLQVDLGKVEPVKTVLLEMEYPTYAYQYRIEVSDDGKKWTTFSDNSQNNKWASPIIAKADAKGRFVRVTIAHTQLAGLPRGIWNVKVYSSQLAEETIWSDPQNMPPIVETSGSSLVLLQASNYREGDELNAITNKGTIAGEWKASSPICVKNYQGKPAFYFDGSNSLSSEFAVPACLDGNASFTFSAWVNNPRVARVEPILTWSRPGHDLTLASVGYGHDPARGAVQHGGWADMAFPEPPTENAWHHLVVSFDGYMERMYLDGKLVKEQNKMLFVRHADRFTIGGSGEEFFSGYLADIQLSEAAWPADKVRQVYQEQEAAHGIFALETADGALGPLESLAVFAQGESAEARASLENGRLDVVHGRVGLLSKSLKVPGLGKMLLEKAFLLELDVFMDGSWKQILGCKSGEGFCFYENGKERKGVRLADYLELIDDELVLEKGAALHALRIHADTAGPDRAGSMYASWRRKSDGRFVSQTIKTDIRPYRINADHVFAEVKPLNRLVSYAFHYGGQSSGWQQQPFYLFRKVDGNGLIEVKVKDIYGNVGKTIQVKPSSVAARDILQGKTKPIGNTDNTFAFWDGLAQPVDHDSTACMISEKDAVWRLASKDTKWGLKGWNGPFLYKELTGDFTVEVQLADVAGLSSSTRTSSEAGLMIQDAADTTAYLNNTILTGWNLGNLVRNMGDRRYQELHTGSGINFDPFLQIQKVGARFYLRSSKDGEQWTNLPGSPFVREDLSDTSLRVGIYQVANNNQLGFGVFKDAKIWK